MFIAVVINKMADAEDVLAFLKQLQRRFLVQQVSLVLRS